MSYLKNPHDPAVLHRGTVSQNADFDEIGKFTRLADEWWDKQGAFKSLHDINPLRLNWIEDKVNEHYGAPLTGKTVLDVGCGGGILSHSMAVRGASVTGVDMGAQNLEAAKIHAAKTGMDSRLDFACVPVEELADAKPSSFDVVTCMEMLEHVPDPAAIVQACFDLLKPGGVCVMSTINRNPKSYLFAIVGAEYVLKMVDKGTHDFNKISDLSVGMWLEGVVTNVTAFGCFVDVGVHQDGLVHISELSDGYVENPSDVVKPQDIVQVRVIAVDEARGRIGFSMKSEDKGAKQPTDKPSAKAESDSRDHRDRDTHKKAARPARRQHDERGSRDNRHKPNQKEKAAIGSFGALLQQAGLK